MTALGWGVRGGGGSGGRVAPCPLPNLTLPEGGYLSAREWYQSFLGRSMVLVLLLTLKKMINVLTYWGIERLLSDTMVRLAL